MNCFFCRQTGLHAGLGARFSGFLVLFFFFAFGGFFLTSGRALAQMDHALEGKASWYGVTAHGKQTACGEVFNRNALTAAHKTLPFGTVVRVHNLKNGRHVLVGITDRGPFINGRVVDLSRKAADIVGMVDSGVAPVRIELVSDKSGAPLNPISGYYLRLTDGKTKDEAEKLTSELMEKRGDGVKYFRLPDRTGGMPATGDGRFIVCLGPFLSFKEARGLFLKLTDSLAPKEVIEGPVIGKNLPEYGSPASSHIYRAAKKPARQAVEQHAQAEANYSADQFD